MNGIPVEPRVLTVSQLNQYLKTRFDADSNLTSVAICGEISNHKKYPSGHHYFSLKDADGILSCIMFSRSAQHLRFRPENGMQVVAFGRVTVFPRDGRYQLYVELMLVQGAGELMAAFEQLKQKLAAEGLFDEKHKKPLPACPSRIAVITSIAGDAMWDMIRILGVRWPMAKIVFLPVRVQGPSAPAELAGAIRYANRWNVADLIIVGRGGGSLEDLWAFNDEQLARTIYDSELPVISAVGHEPDVLISDYVADQRASTPSNAAEIAVPDQQDVRIHLAQLKLRLGRAMGEKMRVCRQKLEHMKGSHSLQNPLNFVQDKRVLVDYQQEKLIRTLEKYVSQRRVEFTALCASLDSLSPLKVLNRGYGLAQDADGRVLTAAANVDIGEQIQLTLSDGVLDCTVTDKRMN